MVPLVPSLLLALSFYVSGQRTVHPAKAYSPNDLERLSEKGVLGSDSLL
jgi:hypothetical protein